MSQHVLVATDPLAAAKSVATLANEHALDSERERRVVDAVFDEILRTKLTDLFVPQYLGGHDVDPVTAIEILKTIAHGDGSVGWVTMILNGSIMTGWLPEPTRRELHAPGDFVLAGMFGPLGKAVPDGDGYRVTGRWPFNSGSAHATWMLGGVLVMDGEEPRLAAHGLPDWRFALFPRSDCTIHDTWRAAGLRATSSHDISVEDIHVPAELLPAPLFEPRLDDGPLSRWSFFGQLSPGIAGVPLGIARRALDEAEDLAAKRGRSGRPPMIASTDVQNDLLGAEAALQAAQAGIVEATSKAWETSLSGERITLDQRAALRLATWHVGRTAVDIVDTCFKLGGGSALYEDVPLQRCWRDIHAATHHIFFSNENLRDGAGVLLGLAEDSFLI